MKLLLRWFSSLKLTVWVLTILIGVFLLGAFLMPLYPGAHTGMNAMPLYQWWLRSTGISRLHAGWLPLSFFVLAILTLNTLVCTIRSLRLAPSLFAHITHAGFLLILLAHLVSAVTGFRDGNILLIQGRPAKAPRLDLTLTLERIELVPGPGGMPKDYSADVIFTGGGESRHQNLGPNHPAFYRGMPVYLTNFGNRPFPYAVCEIVSDPGARVALVGAILFLIGSLPLPYLASRNRTKG